MLHPSTGVRAAPLSKAIAGTAQNEYAPMSMKADRRRTAIPLTAILGRLRSALIPCKGVRVVQ